MTAKTNEALASFMKKQIIEKSTKKNLIEQSIFSQTENQEDKDDEDKEQDSEKLSEEEEKEQKELADAKLASKMKVAQMDQTEMLKKLIIQTAVKLILIVGTMLFFAYGIIELGPKIFSSLNGVLLNAFIDSSK
jgi:hypothetical protein